MTEHEDENESEEEIFCSICEWNGDAGQLKTAKLGTDWTNNEGEWEKEKTIYVDVCPCCGQYKGIHKDFEERNLEIGRQKTLDGGEIEVYADMACESCGWKGRIEQLRLSPRNKQYGCPRCTSTELGGYEDVPHLYTIWSEQEGDTNIKLSVPPKMVDKLFQLYLDQTDEPTADDLKSFLSQYPINARLFPSIGTLDLDSESMHSLFLEER